MPLDHHRKSRVDAWISAFEDAVRKRDYERGRDLFCNNVESFGTVAAHVEGLDCLEADQWHIVWPRTENFSFEPESKRYIVSNDYVVVLARWSSRDLNCEDAQNLRSGRCTIVLREIGAAQEHMQACHTHFSINPGSSA